MEEKDSTNSKDIISEKGHEEEMLVPSHVAYVLYN